MLKEGQERVPTSRGEGTYCSSVNFSLSENEKEGEVAEEVIHSFLQRMASLTSFYIRKFFPYHSCPQYLSRSSFSIHSPAILCKSVQSPSFSSLYLTKAKYLFKISNDEYDVPEWQHLSLVVQTVYLYILTNISFKR